ncbi:MAG: hypothetical protein OXE02_11090 [Chloroflexi bacterium]|nr:hypothetical protein [Chloroflexota bacterium]
MGFNTRRSIECVVLFVTAALFTLLVARLQNWPFELYEAVLVVECAAVVVRGITMPR